VNFSFQKKLNARIVAVAFLRNVKTVVNVWTVIADKLLFTLPFVPSSRLPKAGYLAGPFITF
jgi:hypothetical protein